MNRFVFISFAMLGLIGLPMCTFGQAPAISYLIPDIGTSGMNSYVEIIAPYNANGAFGNDGLYGNNPGDAVRLVCANTGDNSKITIGPLVVSWQGRVISTQIFVSSCEDPNSSDWQSLDSSFKLPLKVIVNSVASNTDTFFIVKPYPSLNVSGGGILGSGGQWGTRSKRGTLLFDSISLGPGTYTISTSDCDPSTIGNQAYLPAVILSKSIVSLASGAILSGSATGKNAGPGGGGGSMGDGPVIYVGGDGFVGGSPGESSPGSCVTNGGEGSGGIGDNFQGGDGLNGIIPEPSDVAPNCEYYGGTGNPFVSEGGGVVTHDKHEGDGNGGGYGTSGENGRGERGNYADSGGIVNGNPMLVPLMGGSGGGGGNEFCSCDYVDSTPGAAGGGGGGGLCLFASVINASNASIQANGASGVTGGYGCVNHSSVGGCGSGGGLTIEAKLSSGFPSVSTAGGISLHTHIWAGNGGAGRVRFDGPIVNSPSIVPNIATTYTGLSTDTTHTPISSLTLHGTGDGDSILFYTKVGNGPWQNSGTVGGYLQNKWSYNLNIDTTQVTYIVAMQQRLDPSTAPATLEPSWVMSQAATNVISKFLSGGSSILSLSHTTQSVSDTTCNSTDTVFKLGGIGCPGVTLESTYFTGSSAFSVANGQNTPRTLDSLDSIRIVFTPTPPGLDTSYLHIQYNLGFGSLDTVITMIGVSKNTSNILSLAPTTESVLDTVCNVKDTSFQLGGVGCPGVTLVSASMTGSSAFSISDVRKTPRTLDSLDSVRIVYSPTPPGDDTSYLHLVYNTGSGNHDTVITLIGTLASSVRAEKLETVSSPQTIQATCVPLSIPIPLWLTGCLVSGGRLDSVWLIGSPAIKVSDARTAPRSLGSFDSIQLQYLPGTTAPDTVVLHLRYDLGSGIQDTTITVIGTIVNPLPPPAITLSASTESILSKSCDGSDTNLRIGITGCPLQNGELDSVWVTGSSTIQISDGRSLPRSLGINDSIDVQYSPTGGGSDTTELHVRYDLGSGIQDTVLTVIGTVASPFLSQPAQIHRELASAYYGGIDSLPLQLAINIPLNFDSIWNLVTDIQATCTFDGSVVSISQYLPPVPWTVVSFTAHPSSFDFEIRNNTKRAQNPLDLGMALFRPRSSELATSWVTMSRLLFSIGNQTSSLCVVDNEDNHWAVKTLGIQNSSVTLPNPVPEGDGISIYPNPAGDELFVQNTNESGTQIEIYDAIGRSVANGNVLPSSTASIDIESLARGSYVLVCHVGDRIITRRISKIQ